MEASNPNFQYKMAIAGYLNIKEERISLFWKGRVGLYALLKALEIGPGDEVVLPGFTCVVVPNAIIYCGAKPVYVDIDPDTYNMDPLKLESNINSRTKLIISQNTYGLPADLDHIQKIARQHHLEVIEDNTHGFGSRYQGEWSGVKSAASFFSSQWNKPFSTGIGGFVVANDQSLAGKLLEMEKTLKAPPAATTLMLAQQLRFRQYIRSSSWYWPAVNAYRWLSKKNLITGSSSGTELISTEMPEDYWMGNSAVQAREGTRQLAKFTENLAHRRTLANFYTSALREMGIQTLEKPPNTQPVYLKYPFFVKNRTHFLQLAEKHRIRLGDWLASPIHPVEDHWEIWQYIKGTCPIAEKISARVLNLPTDPDISLEEAHRIIRFLQVHRQEILSNWDEE